jgi:hypothetical protein
MDDNVHMTGVMLAKEADARRGELERERHVPGISSCGRRKQV